MLYLLSPYSHHDPAVQSRRVSETYQAMVRLSERGYVVFAPTLYKHVGPWTFDMLYMRACTCVLVLMLDGWKRDVWKEIQLAHAMDKPVVYCLPNDVVTFDLQQAD